MISCYQVEHKPISLITGTSELPVTRSAVEATLSSLTHCAFQRCCCWPERCGPWLSSWCWACLAYASVFAPAQTADTMLCTAEASSHDSCVSLSLGSCSSHPSLSSFLFLLFWKKIYIFIARLVWLMPTQLVRATFLCVALIPQKRPVWQFRYYLVFFAISSASSLSLSKNGFSPPVQNDLLGTFCLFLSSVPAQLLCCILSIATIVKPRLRLLLYCYFKKSPHTWFFPLLWCDLLSVISVSCVFSTLNTAPECELLQTVWSNSEGIVYTMCTISGISYQYD